MLKLEGCTVDESGSVTATYHAMHSGFAEEFAHGVKVELVTNAEGAMARVLMEHQPASSEEEALDALDRQLVAVAKAITSRGEPKFCVPAYGT